MWFFYLLSKKESQMKFNIFLLSLVMTSIAFGQRDSTKQTFLTIVQGADSLMISEGTREITLKSEAFNFTFHTLNTDAVFLNCSFDSTAYTQVLLNQKDRLTCFESSQTFAEDEKNYNLDIAVGKFVDDGYHCLYAYADDEQFVRFDKVYVKNPNDWIGVRTVESIYIKPGVGIASLSTLKGKTIYCVFSPSEEKDGQALKITFE